MKEERITNQALEKMVRAGLTAISCMIEARFPREKIARRDKDASLPGIENDRYPGRHMFSHRLVPVPFHEHVDPSSYKASLYHNKLPVNAAHYTMHHP